MAKSPPWGISSKYDFKSMSIACVMPPAIAVATRCTAWCALRFGRYPYDPSWKSASKIGSRMSLSAP